MIAVESLVVDVASSELRTVVLPAVKAPVVESADKVVIVAALISVRVSAALPLSP